MSDDVSSLLRWLFAHDLPEEVVLACKHTEVPKLGRKRQAVVWNGCLMDTPIGIPAQILALGIKRVGVLPCAVNPAEVAKQRDTWESLTPRLVYDAGMLKTAIFRGPEVLAVGAIPMPRRVVLGLGLRDKPPISLKGDDTSRTLESLEVLAAKGLVRRGEGLESKLGGLRIGVSACTACAVCVQACPHNALTLLHHETGSVLWQTSELCRGEQECVQLCPIKGMWVQGDMRLVDLLDEPERKLFVVESAVCEKCGARHPANEGPLCQVCQFRRDNPFGTMAPPAGFQSQ